MFITNRIRRTSNISENDHMVLIPNKLKTSIMVSVFLCCTHTLTFMQTAVTHCTVAVWLSSISRQTEGGEGQRELAQRETGALISDGLTGCMDGAVAQEEK